MANRLINAETSLEKIAGRANDNQLAIEYMALVLGQIFPNLERGLSQYEHILHELDVFVVPKLGICPILRLGKPNLESAMLPNLKIGLPNLGILNDYISFLFTKLNMKFNFIN